VEHRIAWRVASERARRAIARWDPLAPLADEHGEVNDPRGVAPRRVNGRLVPDMPTAVVQAEVAEALSMRRHHYDRDNGQKYRFRKLALCGSRVLIAKCRACAGDRAAIVQGCGIGRLCEPCSLRGAKKRRGRFGRARARMSDHLQRIGYTRSRRSPGGRWADKMMTLTVPHFLLCHVEEGAPLLSFGAAVAEDATMARIYALRAAWPRFARELALWFRRGGTRRAPRRYDVRRRPIAVPLKDGTLVPPPMHRAIEWTPGGDALGHPHVHVWMLSPFIPAEEIQSMWRDALIAVGVPLGPGAHVQVKIQAFRHFDRAAVGELLKGGTRQSLEFSRLYKHGPANAFEYADGWTIAEALRTARPEVVASLYKALEGARLTQGSRGFFVDDARPACGTCGAVGCWHVRFEPVPDSALSPAPLSLERGPP